MTIDSINLLTLLLFSPVIGILILLFVPKANSVWIKTIGIAATVVPLILSIILVCNYNFTTAGYQLEHHVEWIDFQLPLAEQFSLQLNYEVGVDGLSVALILLTTIVSTVAAFASLYIKERWKQYFILFLILEIGMLGVFASQNLFLFFIFFELTIIPTFFLISIWGYLNRESSAVSFLIYNGLGSAVMLITFIVLLMNTYTLNIQELAILMAEPGLFTDTFMISVLIALLIAFGIKLPIFPFHSWMLKVHVQAHPAIVMIHSGILLKLGAYGLIRIGAGIFPEQVVQLSVLLAILGVINILYGAILAFKQKDLKLVMAYSSISHMGIILLGLAALNYSGLQGAIYQAVSHGFISALLFFIILMMYERTNTSMIPDMRGMAKHIPIISGLFMFAAMANLGMPGLSAFIAEFLTFLGLFGTYPWLAALGVLGMILTAVYMLRALLNITFGEPQEKWQSLRDIRGVEWIPALALLAVIVVLGVYPALLGDMIHGYVDYISSLLAGAGG